MVSDHGRTDIVAPGDPLIPEVPRGTPGFEWMPLVAQMGWIGLSRDRRIRSRPAELQAFREHGLRAVCLGGKHDQTPSMLASLFLKYEPRLVRLGIKLEPGPWAATMTPTGV